MCHPLTRTNRYSPMVWQGNSAWCVCFVLSGTSQTCTHVRTFHSPIYLSLVMLRYSVAINQNAVNFLMNSFIHILSIPFCDIICVHLADVYIFPKWFKLHLRYTFDQFMHSLKSEPMTFDIASAMFRNLYKSTSLSEKQDTPCEKEVCLIILNMHL